MSALASVADVVSAVCLVVGGLLTVTAGLGLVRFPDVLSRMHAGSKPQAFGLLVMLFGAALQVGWGAVPVLVLVAVFQVMTVPVATHLLARVSFRTGAADTSRLEVDDLSGALRRPGEDSGPPAGAPAGERGPRAPDTPPDVAAGPRSSG